MRAWRFLSHGPSRWTAIAQGEPLDLVITDILMLERDGFETILTLRRTRPDLRLIAISGGGRLAWKDLLDHAKRFGANQVLVKPFEIEALRQCVREVLKSAA